jgi:hypothetical protein
MPMLDAVRRFAEEPEHELPDPWLPARRVVRSDFVIHLTPSTTSSMVSRVRTTLDGLDATIEGVRGVLREHGYTGCGWFVGPSARPAGLKEHLLKRGFVPAERPPFEPHFTAMVLADAPQTSALNPTIEARRVRDRDEYARAFRAGLRVYGMPEKEIEEWTAGGLVGWDHPNGTSKMTHIALVDGAVAGVGMVNYGPSAHYLCGAAVVPAFRGRGVYRTLVASRWRDAVASGRPALVVHAGAMSQPILKRCGFEEVCAVDVLLDPQFG